LVDLTTFFLALLAGGLILMGYEDGAPENKSSPKKVFQPLQLLKHGEIVPQKHLTWRNYWGTLNAAGENMANVLNTDKQIAIIAALSEGSSIRSIERMTGVHRDTIMRLGVKVGQGCKAL
jgi:hypothetical protein